MIWLGLHGCTHVQTYPEDWPATVETTEHECPDISGTFHNLSVGLPDNYLFDEITAEGIYGRNECRDCIVTLEWTDVAHKQLLVTLRSGHAILIVETLKRDDGDFSCEHGTLVVEYVTAMEIISAGGYGSAHLEFSLAEDGSLILKNRTILVGHVALIVPVAVDGTLYFRWLRATIDSKD